VDRNRIYRGKWQDVLPRLLTGQFSLIYIDPPFNTGKTQRRNSITYADSMPEMSYRIWLRRALVEAYRVLAPNGSILVHLDWRRVHEVKCSILDSIFGKKSFMNEIIWAYDFGGRSKRFWPRKHDTILWYVKDPKNYIFNYDAIDRVPYMAPGLVGAEKAARGKTLTDVHWQTIVPTMGKEKTGYPTQKPIGLIKRFVLVHSNPGDWCLDFFAGSGTLGEACALANRKFVLVDKSKVALRIQQQRLQKFDPKIILV